MSSNTGPASRSTHLDTVDAIGRVAAWYDLITGLTCVIGFRDRVYRQKAVDALGLTTGDTVVDIGCGTGLNFDMLERAVGPAGAIIGVDISDAMLARARQRAVRHGWSNVELVQSDAADYEFPAPVDGILSTYALMMVDQYDQLTERGCFALRQGRRFAVLDQKLPPPPASLLVPLVDCASRWFPYSRAIKRRWPYLRTVTERRLWESIRKHAGNVRVEAFYFGFVYVAVGEKQPAPGASIQLP